MAAKKKTMRKKPAGKKAAKKKPARRKGAAAKPSKRAARGAGKKKTAKRAGKTRRKRTSKPASSRASGEPGEGLVYKDLLRESVWSRLTGP